MRGKPPVIVLCFDRIKVNFTTAFPAMLELYSIKKEDKMKQLIIIFTIFVITLLLSVTTFAATFTEPSRISFIGVYRFGNIGVQLENSNIANPNNCSKTTSATKIYKIVDTTEHGKNMYSLVLASKASGVNVKLVVNETQCSPEDYVIINGVVSY